MYTIDAVHKENIVAYVIPEKFMTQILLYTLFNNSEFMMLLHVNDDTIISNGSIFVNSIQVEKWVMLP